MEGAPAEFVERVFQRSRGVVWNDGFGAHGGSGIANVVGVVGCVGDGQQVRQGRASHARTYHRNLADAARGGPVPGGGFLGMSVEGLLGTCSHDHPDFLRDAATPITSKPKQNARIWGVISGVDSAADREKRQEFHGRSGRIRTCDPLRPERK
jgi:hypothetical protein